MVEYKLNEYKSSNPFVSPLSDAQYPLVPFALTTIEPSNCSVLIGAPKLIGVLHVPLLFCGQQTNQMNPVQYDHYLQSKGFHYQDV